MNLMSKVEVVYFAVPVASVVLVSALLSLQVSAVESRVGLLSSTVIIFLLVVLVWERVRNAVVLRLDFLARLALAPIVGFSLQGFRPPDFDGGRVFDYSNRIISRYGRFLFVKLYPEGLMTLLQTSTSTLREYSNVLEQASVLGRRDLRNDYCAGCLLQAAGLPVDERHDLSKLEKHRRFQASLLNENPDLSGQFISRSRELSANLTGLRLIIETFLDQNLAEISSAVLSLENESGGPRTTFRTAASFSDARPYPLLRHEAIPDVDNNTLQERHELTSYAAAALSTNVSGPFWHQENPQGR